MPAVKFDAERIAALFIDYTEGLSITQLVEKYGCVRSVILNRLREAGAQPKTKPRMTDSEKENAKSLYDSGMTFAEVGAATGRHENTILHLMNKQFPDSVRSGTIGPGSPHWNGGRNSSHGYTYVWVSDSDPMFCMAVLGGRGVRRYVLEHRLVLARKIGRPLRDTETAHHIDGDKSNNSPENLELRQGKHGKHVVMRCMDCGSRNIGHAPLSSG